MPESKANKSGLSRGSFKTPSSQFKTQSRCFRRLTTGTMRPCFSHARLMAPLVVLAYSQSTPYLTMETPLLGLSPLLAPTVMARRISSPLSTEGCPLRPSNDRQEPIVILRSTTSCHDEDEHCLSIPVSSSYPFPPLHPSLQNLLACP